LREKLRIATLFSGIGTPEIALRELGVDFSITFACEIDKYARKTYLANHNINKEHFHDDVSAFDAKRYKDSVDILIAGSPCQPFSIAGYKEGFDDPRGKLFFDMIDRIDECNPKVVLFENVKNILTHNNKKTFKIVVDEFKRIGYKNISYRIVDAREFGSIQRRKRLFLIASKEQEIEIVKKREISNNESVFEEILEENIPEKYLIQTKSRKYLDDEVQVGKIVRNRWDFKYHLDTGEQYSPTMTANLSVGVPNNVLIDRDMCKFNLWTCDFAGSELCSLCSEFGENYQHNYNPTPAVRRLMPREVARLQGIKDSFSFPVSDTQAYRQIGNSMEIKTLKTLLLDIKNNLEEVAC